VLIGGLPAGSGYTITLSATSTDGNTTCAGQAQFAVVAGQTVGVNVDLICDAPDNDGQITVNGRVDNCPRLTFYSVAPLTVGVGGHISLNAAATDLDPATTLAFSWTSAVGTIAPPGAAVATYTCTQAGAQTLNLSVTDGLCADTAAVQVNCISIGCGNGTVEGNETCDPPGSVVGGVTCPADCTLPVCGDLVLEAPETCDDGNTNPADNCDNCRIPSCGDMRVNGNEQCDPPNGTTCNATCRSIVCGDGIVEGLEQCDPPGSATPGGGTCSPTCTIGMAAPRCGDGIINGTDQCEGPDSPGNIAQPSGSAQGCGATCQNLMSAACVNCEANTECAEFAVGCEHPLLAGVNAIGGPAAGTPRKALCYETAECVRRTGCAAGPNGVSTCLCGTADATACLSGGANGPCLATYQRSLESTDPAQLSAFRFADPQYGGGLVNLRLICNADAATCPGQCP
jgi:hypothetical protein